MARGLKEGKLVKEYDIQRRMCEELKGKAKLTPAGYIDILTETHIIEIKIWNQLFKGIGQLLMYSIHHPDKQKQLHMFGAKPADAIVQTARDLCVKYNIELTEET